MWGVGGGHPGGVWLLRCAPPAARGGGPGGGGSAPATGQQSLGQAAGAFLFFAGVQEMITPLYEALAAVRAHAHPLAAEDVSLTDACGRVLAEGVRAPRDQPATDISMMAGHALRP